MDFRITMVIKMLATMVYAGGALAGFMLPTREQRKKAVHMVASSALLVIWIAGYILMNQMSYSFGEAWIHGGFFLSFVAHGVLTSSVKKENRTVPAIIFSVLIAIIVAIMVFRPGWH